MEEFYKIAIDDFRKEIKNILMSRSAYLGYAMKECNRKK